MKNLIRKLQNLPCAVGIIDSGIGGISVLNALESSGIHTIVYVADTAYLPYGQQPYETLLQRGRFMTDFLLSQGITTIFVACHTLSATILPELESLYSEVVFIDLLVPTVTRALEVTRTKVIGVLATSNTVQSERYPRAIAQFGSEYTVIQQACPDFVSLLEAPTLNQQALTDAITLYLQPFIKTKVDTLILGCTHYAFLTPLFTPWISSNHILVSASGCVKSIFALNNNEIKTINFCVTGDIDTFKVTSDRVLSSTFKNSTRIHYFQL